MCGRKEGSGEAARGPQREGTARTTSAAHRAWWRRRTRPLLVSLGQWRDRRWGALGDLAVTSVWPREPRLCLRIVWFRGSCSSPTSSPGTWALGGRETRSPNRAQRNASRWLPRLGLVSAAELFALQGRCPVLRKGLPGALWGEMRSLSPVYHREGLGGK